MIQAHIQPTEGRVGSMRFGRSPEQQEARILEGLELDRQFGVGQDMSVLDRAQLRPSGSDEWADMPDRTFADSRKYLIPIGIAVATFMAVSWVHLPDDQPARDPFTSIAPYPQANN